MISHPLIQVHCLHLGLELDPGELQWKQRGLKLLHAHSHLLAFRLLIFHHILYRIKWRPLWHCADQGGSSFSR